MGPNTRVDSDELIHFDSYVNPLDVCNSLKFSVKNLKRIGWDIDLVAVLLNGPATLTESELKMDWIMNSVNFQSRLRRNFSGSVNFQAVFSSDSVNVAGPLSKTTTKSMSQPILWYDFQELSIPNGEATFFYPKTPLVYVYISKLLDVILHVSNGSISSVWGFSQCLCTTWASALECLPD